MISPPHLSGSQQRPGVLLFCLSLLIAGCTSIGPPTVRRDRLDYADAMADASKRETLLEHRQAALRRHPEHGHGQSAGRGLHAGGSGQPRLGFLQGHFRSGGRRQHRRRRHLQRSPYDHLRADQGRRFRPSDDEPDPPKRTVRHGRRRHGDRSHSRARRADPERAAQLDGRLPRYHARRRQVRRGA